ncbi:inositol polyphosphate 1-phosphatase-like isoform X4 [Polyodon spathula]|uniref:inositol polyphosphate 1-phosphatase-like isoform X4 n=1 Tax=Polyodon spathula TaxID=7913 RepID=UPI001B7DBA51|nr:inositol polyphosphate 1-phosphatase-like isoform X4 [Polyodon spathula]
MVEYSSRSTGKHSSKLGLLSPEDKRSTGFEDKMSDMIAALVHASEKAAKIARACRLEESLFGLLIEEKKEGEKNKKFVTDFKTLADVLVQEVIKHDVGKQFPGIENNIFGEESNEFMNGLDSTFQYIKGVSDSKPNNNIYSCGLQCVTILIGVYDLHSGTPIMGVVNQPFAVQDPETQRWSGQYYWGISYGTTNVCSLGPHSKNGGVSSESNSMPAPQHLKKGSAADLEEERFSAVLSTGETVCVQTLLKEACGDNIHYAAGAGYKSLCVVLGFVDVYVFSEDTTFKWDCCSPHAILKSLGGGMADLKECLRRRQDGNREDCSELVYNVPVQDVKGADRWANKGGLVAYRSHKHLEAVLNLLSGISV